MPEEDLPQPGNPKVIAINGLQMIHKVLGYDLWTINKTIN